MKTLFDSKQTTNCKRFVFHTDKHTYSFITSDFAQALSLFNELGFDTASIRHVDIANEKVDGIDL